MENIKPKIPTRELATYIAVGILTVLTDMTVYYVLLNYFNHNFAKSLSFFSGTIVAFTLNKFYTFKQRRFFFSELCKFYALYFSTFLINVTINHISLLLTKNVFFSFLTATAISTTLNFLGQKFWVFNSENQQ